MKQRNLEGYAKRQWSATTRPWNALALAESLEKKRAHETTVSVSAEVPLQFVNAMLRKGFLSESQVKEDKIDTKAIAEILLSSTREKLYGRVTAARYS